LRLIDFKHCADTAITSIQCGRRPAIGESSKVAIIDITQGADKPLPCLNNLLRRLLILTKVDLDPWRRWSSGVRGLLAGQLTAKSSFRRYA
jgi:hypothetical protein